MAAMIVVTLRERLRQDTRTAHDAVDRAFGRFDLAAPPGVAAFLEGQRDAVTALRAGMTATDRLSERMDEALVALDADLAALDVAGAADPPPQPKRDHPLARTYIWLASRMGTRMLSRRWRSATDPAVTCAHRYFDGLADRADWRGFTEALEEKSGRGREADHALQAANQWFALFEHCAVRIRTRGGDG